ncbi:zinc finger, CCHC-type containing protein [Tanacetum coccineum]
MVEPTSEVYIVNAQNKSSLSITSNDINIEPSKEFLKELQMNTYHGWIDEDVINHIAMVLKMIDSIYIFGVDSHQLRMKIFPLSLADEAKQWWINKGEGKITIWEELVEKFFCKFYPESYDGEEEMLDEGDNWGIDPLEFISRVNSSFDKHMKMDGRTKKVLFHAWMNGSWNKRQIDNSILSNNKTTTDSFFKPYLITCGKYGTEKEDGQSQTKRK